MSPSTRSMMVSNASGSPMPGKRIGTSQTPDTKKSVDDFADEMNQLLARTTIEMSCGIARPQSIRWLIDDAAHGKNVHPLGTWFPKASLVCIAEGAAFSNVTAPLDRAKAKLRQFAGLLTRTRLADALLREQKEQSEADLAELELAECVDRPSRSALHSFVKESKEHVEAELVAIEAAEDALLEMERVK